jgi:hypothetical protein
MVRRTPSKDNVRLDGGLECQYFEKKVVDSTGDLRSSLFVASRSIGSVLKKGGRLNDLMEVALDGAMDKGRSAPLPAGLERTIMVQYHFSGHTVRISDPRVEQVL